MRPLTALATLALILAAPVAAQNPPPGPGGPGRGTPPPDHWMTIDSLSQTLGLSADQKTKIAQPYTALNGVMKQAADRRAELMKQFQAGGGGGFTPGQPMDPAMQARRDSLRKEFDGMQEEADQWYQMIRGALTPEQQTKFDALPPPRVAMRRRPPGGQ